MEEYKVEMKEFCEIIKEKNIDVDIILEVGSLHGLDGKIIKDEFPGSKLYIIEGSEENYKRYGLDEMNNEENIFTFNVAISDKNESRQYYQKDGTGGTSGFFESGRKTTSVLTVDTITLKQFCDTNNINKIDVMKLDIEGASFEGLIGMHEYLDKTKIIHIELEEKERFVRQKYLANESRNLLKEKGFECLVSRPVNANRRQFDDVWFKK